MDKTFEELANATEADRPEYKMHKIFSELDRAIQFYDQLDFSVMSFATMGTRSIINIDSFLYSSISGTLESIKAILEKGRVGDAFCLLRKYYDSCILNLYTNVYLENTRKDSSIFVKEILEWMEGKETLPHSDFRSMLPYLRSSGKSKEILDLIFTDDAYKQTRDRCNDHTHYNYFHTVLINDNKMRLESRIARLDDFLKDFENIFILHVSSLFYINDHYMMSSDYIDSLELGFQPQEGSQYWVAPYIQSLFTDYIDIKRPDLAAFIKKNTGMQLK